MGEIADDIVREYKLEQYYKKKLKKRKQSINFDYCMKHRCEECKYNEKCFENKNIKKGKS